MLAFLMLAACAPDLPEGWVDAQKIEDLTQSECGGDPYGDYEERVEASSQGTSLAVDYLEAHFRCSQDVEGWYREGDAAVDVLVQPVDMNPGSVAKCDCLYEITMTVPVAPPVLLTLYRRWDNLNDDNDPVEVGSVDVAE